jgi:hypothetical protein
MNRNGFFFLYFGNLGGDWGVSDNVRAWIGIVEVSSPSRPFSASEV